jgi:dolichyl-phosphate-mannose-protein mannosyltransferase
MIWFLSTAAIVGYIAVRGILILRAQRGYRDFESSTQHLYVSRCLSSLTLPLSQGCQV